jgi:hypothetical protein
LIFEADFLKKELIIATFNLGKLNADGKKLLAKFKRMPSYSNWLKLFK